MFNQCKYQAIIVYITISFSATLPSRRTSWCFLFLSPIHTLYLSLSLSICLSLHSMYCGIFVDSAFYSRYVSSYKWEYLIWRQNKAKRKRLCAVNQPLTNSIKCVIINSLIALANEWLQIHEKRIKKRNVCAHKYGSVDGDEQAAKASTCNRD